MGFSSLKTCFVSCFHKLPLFFFTHLMITRQQTCAEQRFARYRQARPRIPVHWCNLWAPYERKVGTFDTRTNELMFRFAPSMPRCLRKLDGVTRAEVEVIHVGGTYRFKLVSSLHGCYCDTWRKKGRPRGLFLNFTDVPNPHQIMHVLKKKVCTDIANKIVENL